MCGTVRNVCGWHQCFGLVELIVALLCTPDSTAHARGLLDLAEACNGSVRPYLRNIGACTSMCDWHQCFKKSLYKCQKVGKARKLSDVLLMLTTDDGPRACYRVSDTLNSIQ